MKKTIYCEMLTMGQEVVRLTLPWEEECPLKEDIRVDGPFRETARNRYIAKTKGISAGDVTEVKLENGLLTIDVVSFSNRVDFTVRIGDKVIQKADFDETVTEGLDAFEKIEEGIVKYRLYSPKEAKEKRPLILFLHGGGNGGTEDGRDNEKQLIADYGPINFSLKYPDIYVLAPQAIEIPFHMNPLLMAGMRRQRFDQEMDPRHGWSREYLSKVIDIIRRMIREGKVDEKRVYVTGLSMGGAGTCRAMSVGADLFAAAAPVCPTMTQETFNYLRTTKMPVWVSSAYVDHTVYRHKYLADAVIQLKDNGHKNAHLTLYSPEELEAYGIGLDPELSYKDLFAENHASWVLTYHDEYGIMSWLLNQHK